MLLFVLNLLIQILFIRGTIFQCDFETTCHDFDINRNWGITNGFNPQPIDHDHTLYTSSGHYLFLNRQNGTRFPISEIKSKEWIQPSINRTICFRMWYYTTELDLPFNIQLLQGYDEQLIRIVALIPGKDPTLNDWTLVNLTLPNEQIKIAIRLNITNGPLAIDDLSIDYCDQSYPSPNKILFTCDFESNCKDQFVSLPYYPYQWSIIQANDASQIEDEAPSIDYTYLNQSGHYLWLSNNQIIDKGNVGYVLLQKVFNLSFDQTYCLNFQYYGYGRSYTGDLKVYALLPGDYNMVQLLWPRKTYNPYFYTNNKWTWGIINLPAGYYSLLFYVDTTDIIPHSFALDNIEIISCNYPSTRLISKYSMLYFNCDFDNMTMCGMKNDDSSTSITNFTILTGDTIPNRELGPIKDHTSNSSTGGFAYWNQRSPSFGDYGRLVFPSGILQNFGMCIRFAYYVNSTVTDKQATTLRIYGDDCYQNELWKISLDNSQGWQIAIIPLPNFACNENFYIGIQQGTAVRVSAAFDDIDISQCNSFSPTTTTTTTTTTTAVTDTSIMTSQSTLTSILTTTSSITTSTRNNAKQLLYTNELILTLSFCFMIKFFFSVQI